MAVCVGVGGFVVAVVVGFRNANGRGGLAIARSRRLVFLSSVVDAASAAAASPSLRGRAGTGRKKDAPLGWLSLR